LDKLPSDLISEIDELLGLKGRPYLRLTGDKLERTEGYQWSEAESTLEIWRSISPELGEAMADSQEMMSKFPFSLTDPMSRMRKHIARKAPHLVEEYDHFVERLEEAEHRVLYPTGKEPPSLPEELKEPAERIADKASSGMKGDNFDLDAYMQRSLELWQLEPVEVQAIQRQYQEELIQYQDSLNEAQKIKQDRLAAVRAHIAGKPFKAYGDVVIAPTDDQYEILRIEQTNGANYGIQTEDIIRALESVDMHYGIDILNARFDFVKFKIAKLPSGEKAEELKEKLLKLCPDLEGEDELIADGVIELWWD
jgi:hypothetical protein